MRLVKLVALVAAMMAGPAALAHEQGSIVLRGGAANVSPNEDSDRIDIAGLAVLDGVTVDSNTQLGLTLTYMFTDNLGLGVLASTPFEHDIYVKNAPVKAGSTKHLPPTITLQYFFGEASSAFRPYVGAGINNTTFFEEKPDAQLGAALESITGVPVATLAPELDLDASWGYALEAGFDYELGEKWGLNAAIWYIDISTDATVSTTIADVPFNVDIDPFVYMIGLSYKF